MTDLASTFRPVAPPRIIEDAYTKDQYERLLAVARENGPWSLILAQHFKSPEEVIATTSGSVPEGFTPTWDMFLSPVFRGYLGENGAALYRDIEDCYYNSKFLDLVRSYWGAEYAVPELMLFNIQGPTASGGSPHLDGTWFRGLGMEQAPVWLLNTMSKSGMFKHWQAKKAQVIAWYYKGRIGGGFTYWPDGPRNSPKVLEAPMWGRAVVVENEMMYHSAQANGPVSTRGPVDRVYHVCGSRRSARLGYQDRRQGGPAHPRGGIPLSRPLGRPALYGLQGIQDGDGS